MRDERGSIPLALLLALVAMSLSALMVPMVIAQLDVSREQAQRTAAFNAAQTGLDVAVAHIRGALATGEDPLAIDPVGDVLRLPCSLLDGTLSTGGTARYQVRIRYFNVDPQGKLSAWLAANGFDCPTNPLAIPGFVLLTSTGSDRGTGVFDPKSSRTLYATYTLRKSNKNVAGGLIPMYYNTGVQLCMDAGSDTPKANDPLIMMPCTAGSTRQQFEYNTNLTIALVSSKTAINPLGLCVDAASQTVNEPVLFQVCGSTTTPRQQWSYNDGANLQGTTNGVDLNGICIHVRSTNSPGSDMFMNNCNSPNSVLRTFSPEPAVGAGAAGPEAGQLVNFNQFGRCLDVTEFRVDYGYLINWPCKQAPDPAQVNWNQKFSWPALGTKGLFTTYGNGQLYCLHTVSPVRGSYVFFEACTNTATDQDLKWTVYGKTDSYRTSYQVADEYGNCLQPADPNEPNPELYHKGNQVSKVVVRPCDGSTLQKWNAPANILRSIPLKDIREQ